jgi:hypothetical protein
MPVIAQVLPSSTILPQQPSFDECTFFYFEPPIVGLFDGEHLQSHPTLSKKPNTQGLTLVFLATPGHLWQKS